MKRISIQNDCAGKFSTVFWIPIVTFKCWLFVAMSQMQQKQLKKSKAIIQNVYDQVKSQEDQTLSKMCLGIWARLQHKWNNSHSNRMNI